ncbi:hypothetical protein HC928_26100 [bacterium]|nr:hypothetical protein [bacterium]
MIEGEKHARTGSHCTGHRSYSGLLVWRQPPHPRRYCGAQAFEGIYPHIHHVFRTLRGYQTWMTRYIAGQGIDQFLVFGAGIPTGLHVHEVVPQARTLYTDIDPLCVQYGQQILADIPTADYIICDITDLASLDRGRAELDQEPALEPGAFRITVVEEARYRREEEERDEKHRAVDRVGAVDLLLGDGSGGARKGEGRENDGEQGVVAKGAEELADEQQRLAPITI